MNGYVANFGREIADNGYTVFMPVNVRQLREYKVRGDDAVYESGKQRE
jgi:hypothetical protein